jgi:Mce-associated membrane protein
MLIDTDLVTDASPPELRHEHPAGADVGTDERADVAAEAEAADEADLVEAAETPAERGARFSWTRLLAYGVLPGLALILALAAGYLKWQADSARVSQAAGAESVHAATDGTIAILSYRPDTVDRNLTAAADRLTGTFRDQYTQLINDVVAPGAKQKQISAVATVPAAASVSATADHAVVLVLVNQTTVIGNDPPTATTSSVRLTLDKVHGRWLISQFDPV